MSLFPYGKPVRLYRKLIANGLSPEQATRATQTKAFQKTLNLYSSYDALIAHYGDISQIPPELLREIARGEKLLLVDGTWMRLTTCSVNGPCVIPVNTQESISAFLRGLDSFNRGLLPSEKTDQLQAIASNYATEIYSALGAEDYAAAYNAALELGLLMGGYYSRYEITNIIEAWCRDLPPQAQAEFWNGFQMGLNDMSLSNMIALDTLAKSMPGSNSLQFYIGRISGSQTRLAKRTRSGGRSSGSKGQWSTSGTGSGQFIHTQSASALNITYSIQKKIDGYIIAKGPDGKKYVFGQDPLANTQKGTLDTKWTDKQFYYKLKAAERARDAAKNTQGKTRWQKTIDSLGKVLKVLDKLDL